VQNKYNLAQWQTYITTNKQKVSNDDSLRVEIRCWFGISLIRA
jgi:hypothetical protein